MTFADRIKAWVAWFQRHRTLSLALQAVAAVVFLGFLVWAVRGTWREAGDRLRDANPLDFGIACIGLAAYYLLFVVGWMRILGAWGIRMPYPAALRAEMVSMLAKYIPGGVWTPAARVVAARRAGVTDAALVTASMLVEAGLSAVAGIVVFVISLAWMDDVNAPLAPLLAFGVLVSALLHPRIFQPLAARVVRKLGYPPLPPLPMTTMLFLLVFYSFTWLVGGAALLFLIRSVGGNPGPESIAFLGGVAAVGAIVAVLAVFAPSGLGVREASMYGLLLAVASPAAALGATVLNRIAITVVEIALLVVGAFFLRGRDQEAEVRLTESEHAGRA
ncbi:MAG TPA: lysylphosphatidylglycerol synthase domain-containing protein [Gaiellaceae bacterium]|jgi:hypothetical protein